MMADKGYQLPQTRFRLRVLPLIPRTKDILARVTGSEEIQCGHYFNRSQVVRLVKIVILRFPL